MEKIRSFLFTNTSPRQTIAKNTIWLFLSEGVGRGLKMILVIYAARVLGAGGWGTFSYVLSLASLVMVFSDIGLSGLITREIVQKKEGYRTFISSALFIKTSLLMVSTLIVVFIGPSLSQIPEARTLFPIVALVLFFDAVRDFALAINTAFEKMERDMIAKSIMNITIVGLGIGLLQFNTVPQSVAIAYAIGSALGCAIALSTIWRDAKNLFTRFDSTLFALVMRTTWPFALITLISTILSNTDIYLLGLWRSPEEIGLYSSMQRIQQFLLFIPGMIATAVFPLVSRLATKDDEHAGHILEKTTAFLLLIGIPLTAGGIMLAPQIVTLLFGAGYIGAVPILRVLFGVLLVSFPLVLFLNSIFAYDGQKSIANAYFFGFIANIILNILFIPRFGAIGSAIATLIATIIITGLMWHKLKRITRFHVTPQLKGITLSSIAMMGSIVLCMFFEVTLIPTVCIAIFVYAGTILLIKDPLIEELFLAIKTKTIA